MTTQQSHGIADELTEKAVVEYLRSHLDFFVVHSHLLAELMVPHVSGEAVSLIERQVSVLRDQNRQVRRELMELVQIARENDRLNDHLQRLTVALMEATSLSDIFFILHDALRNDFNAEVVTIRLFVPAQLPVEEANQLVALAFSKDSADELTAFKKIMAAGKPVCGRLAQAQLHYLFGEKATDIASAALVPLSKSTRPVGAGVVGGSDKPQPPTALEQCFGMMAIGSLDAERFHPAMGTLFLTYLSAIVSSALAPYLKLPAAT